MIWPTYTFPAAHLPPEIVRHNLASPDLSGRKVYSAALDVWRAGEHLWRSWHPATGTSLIDWTESEYGDNAPANYDDGLWRIPEVHGAVEWPIPTPASLAPVGSARDLRDLFCTVLAIGQWPGLEGLDRVPLAGTITSRIWRASRPYSVFQFSGADVSVRAMVGQVEVAAMMDSDAETYRARLERREVKRSDAVDVDLGDRVEVFRAPKGADVRVIARHAKDVLGIPGWPAQRQPGLPMVWHLSRAPYRMTIEKVES